MHHWTMSTSMQTGVPKDHVEFFQNIIPEVGFRNPFVSHAILSVAALHIAHLSEVDRQQHIIRAVQHHNAGLEGFKDAVSEISKENSEALFIWSTLNSLYVLSLATQSSLQVMDRNDRILGVEWIPMLLGVTAILHPIFEHLQHGRIKNLLTLRGWKDLDPDKPFDGCLEAPLSRVRESWQDSIHAATYEAAFTVLRKCLLFVSQFDATDNEAVAGLGYNRALSGSLVFIHASPRDFFTLLHQREPPALILFAYFGVLLHEQRDCWVIDSLGRDILEVVGELLDSRWKCWLPKGTDLQKATLLGDT
ncbi:C6 zinc finger domain-containing protein [Sarocladium strictum]